jgi:hypothetical protein
MKDPISPEPSYDRARIEAFAEGLDMAIYAPQQPPDDQRLFATAQSYLRLAVFEAERLCVMAHDLTEMIIDALGLEGTLEAEVSRSLVAPKESPQVGENPAK